MGAGSYGLTDAVPLPVPIGQGLSAPYPAPVPLTNSRSVQTSECPGRIITETTAAMRELAERRYTV